MPGSYVTDACLPNRVINASTPVQVLADGSGLTAVLQHQRITAHSCNVRFVSAPHPGSLKGDF